MNLLLTTSPNPTSPLPIPIAMDSTPQPILSINPSSASKLPVKRKLPASNPESADDDSAGDFSTPPPFKFHRIWTEPDEIRFLQGLLDCSADRLLFPRDLHIFYARFSGSMSQPYTKSQLSEKLRRLRKKFRVISSRLERGIDASLLSPHDRALYELCRKLWSPEHAATSPFGKNVGSAKKLDGCNLVGVKVSFSPTLPLVGSFSNQNLDDDDNENVNLHHEVNVGYDFGGKEEELCLPLPCVDAGGGGGLAVAAATAVLNVFDQSLKEFRLMLVKQGLLYPDPSAAASEFERRWRDQRIAELDALARRLRLVLQNSLPR